jgi:hypothetical protein
MLDDPALIVTMKDFALTAILAESSATDS